MKAKMGEPTMKNRRDFILSAAAGATATLYAFPAAAGPAGDKTQTQVIGVNQRGVGDIKVTALLDGYIQIEPSNLTGSDEATIKTLMSKAFLSGKSVDTSINAYVIEAGERVILVDGGAGDAFGPTGGKLGAALALAGYTPESIDGVFCTHLHPDHVALLTDGEKARFGGATFYTHEAEAAFWSNNDNFAGANEQVTNFRAMALRTLLAYRDATNLVKDGETIAPGVDIKHLPGHTPGHSGLLLSSGDASMLLWADIVHVGVMQFANPGWTIPFDADQPQAAKTRKALFDMVATDRLEVAGSHIDFPSFGHLEKAGQGYSFTPSRWDHEI